MRKLSYDLLPEAVLDLQESVELLNRKLASLSSSVKLPAKVDIDTAADLTGLSKSTLYKFVCDRRIPNYKVKGKLLFDTREIEDWLRQYRRKTKAEISESI